MNNNFKTRALLFGTSILGVVMLAETAAIAQTSGDSQQNRTAAGGDADEIVVTATRRAELLSRVPMSVAAFNQESMDKRGIRQLDDVMRFTPGVNMTRGASTLTQISIRGVNSTTGAGTTGIMIDDTPIQIRSLGSQPRNAIPNVFDLERVEILRGPQGTLFGAGAQGGVVRFITPKPSLDKLEVYARGELAFTEGGAPTYEAGVAVGAPLIEDKLGFRISAYHRKDGGFIDRGPYLPGSVTPLNTVTGRGQVRKIDRENSNDFDTYALRAALMAKIGDNITITPSVLYNLVESADINTAWHVLSDAPNKKFVSGNPRASTNKDYYWLPSLQVDIDLGFATLASNTSFFVRRESGLYDYTQFDLANFPRNMTPENPFGNFDRYLSFPDFDSRNLSANFQDNFSQEIRLASNDSDSRLNWVVGFFYNAAKQRSTQSVQNRYFSDFIGITTGPSDLLVYDETLTANDKQTAVFGEVTWEVVDRLKLIAGLRYAKTSFNFVGEVFGLAAGPAGYIRNEGSQSDSPLTPRLGVQYQWDDDNLTYFTAAKGYRIGGSNRAIPPTPQCLSALNAIGYQDGAPTAYDSDNVWSYELGSKNSLFDGKVRIAAAAYLIKWSGIIRNVSLGTVGCPYSLIANLGEATSKGLEFESTFLLSDSLTIGAAIGYNNIEYDKTVQISGAPEPIVAKGQTLGGTPWSVILNLTYDFEALGVPAYFRADYTYDSVNRGLTTTNDPTFARTFDPTFQFGPPNHELRARLGMRLESGPDVSLFVNNLLNQTDTGFNGSRFQPMQTFVPRRPRTFGLTATYRY